MYVIYQSHNPKALQGAEEIARAAQDRGMDATIAPIDAPDLNAIVSANVLVAGCSTKVNTPFGGETTSATRRWIDDIPDLNGKPCAVYCTFRFFPHTFADVTTRTSEVLERLERGLEMKGGKIVASRAFHHRKMAEGADALVAEIVEHI